MISQPIKNSNDESKRNKNFTGGFITSDQKSTNLHGRTVSVDWKNTSDRKESLSDPRWHKRPPTKDKKTKVTDARDFITGTKTTKFPKTIIGDTSTATPTGTKGGNSPTTVPRIAQVTIATQTVLQNQMEKEKSSTSTQTISNTETNLSMEQEKEIYVSRVDPNVCLQEETAPNVEPPTMTTSL